MKNNKFLTDTLILINLGQSMCKLVLPVGIRLEKGNKLSSITENVKQRGRQNIEYSIGYFTKMLKEKKLILSEIDIILPLDGHYLRLSEDDTLHKKYKINYLCGSAISIPDFDINSNMKFVENQIKEFSKANVSNN